MVDASTIITAASEGDDNNKMRTWLGDEKHENFDIYSHPPANEKGSGAFFSSVFLLIYTGFSFVKVNLLVN
jgi:hypothetical protein